MPSTKALSAEAYAEQKGIYAILQHLALTLLEKSGDEAHEEEAAATWQKSAVVGRRPRVPLRPQDPLAFLASYVASPQGQQNLERSVQEYVSKRGITQNIHVREEAGRKEREERVPGPQTVVVPSPSKDNEKNNKKTARDGEENKAAGDEKEGEATLRHEVKCESKSDTRSAEQSQGSRLVQEEDTVALETTATPPNPSTPIKGETEPEASPSAFTDDNTKANTKSHEPVKSHEQQQPHPHENELTQTDLEEENEANVNHDLREAHASSGTVEDAEEASKQPRMSSSEALVTETHAAVEERREVLVHSESASEAKSEKGDVDEHDYGKDNDEEEAAAALATNLGDEEHLQRAESERVSTEEM